MKVMTIFFKGESVDLVLSYCREAKCQSVITDDSEFRKRIILKKHCIELPRIGSVGQGSRA
jgi:hypothetical protein